jgi:hypothetical protein
MSITRNLIGGFLQTRSIDIINQASLSHELVNYTFSKLYFSLIIDAKDGRRQVSELYIL